MLALIWFPLTKGALAQSLIITLTGISIPEQLGTTVHFQMVPSQNIPRTQTANFVK